MGTKVQFDDDGALLSESKAKPEAPKASKPSRDAKDESKGDKPSEGKK